MTTLEMQLATLRAAAPATVPEGALVATGLAALRAALLIAERREREEIPT